MIVATGATSVSVDVQIVDDSGLPVTGLNAASFPAVSYSLAGPQAAVAISLSNLAAITSAWSSGGLKERAVGYYRLDVPDAAFASAGTIRLEAEASGKHLLAAEIQVGVAPIVNGVWDELLAGHATVGSAGEYLGAFGAAYVAGTLDCNIGRDLLGNVGQNVLGNVDGFVSFVNGDVFGSVLGNPLGPIVGPGVWAFNETGANVASPGDAMTLTSGERTAVATALLDLANGVETSVTLRQALRAIAAGLAANVTGGGTSYKALANAGTTRLAVVDNGGGDRTVTPTL